ncbi:MAG: NifB/NifX family molybdenum-iron cluster-binding protein [Bacteroidales bacterium]|jgi:predicted Fe-Mo cluster-binding NifX family protein|nr:NifB/NifX family molybdenum-iron cluster-binding protein [Bacteroidales bacterium]
MKIAIASTGHNLESKLDQRFGRCAYFFIYDTADGSLEIIPNPNKDRDEFAGPASVQLIATKNVRKIISGEFGLKIKSQLDSLKIQMIVIRDKKVIIKEIIKMLNH